jgi:hypothetical protein
MTETRSKFTCGWQGRLFSLPPVPQLHDTMIGIPAAIDLGRPFRALVVWVGGETQRVALG